jgi:hypothetical protein
MMDAPPPSSLTKWVGRVARTEEASARVISVIADIPVADVGSARSFYADYLGLSVEEFNMGWVARWSIGTELTGRIQPDATRSRSASAAMPKIRRNESSPWLVRSGLPGDTRNVRAPSGRRSARKNKSAGSWRVCRLSARS